MSQEQKAFKWVGTRQVRPDGVPKVTGDAKFGADYYIYIADTQSGDSLKIAEGNFAVPHLWVAPAAPTHGILPRARSKSSSRPPPLLRRSRAKCVAPRACRSATASWISSGVLAAMMLIYTTPRRGSSGASPQDLGTAR